MLSLALALELVARDAPGWHAEFVANRRQLRHWIDTGAIADPAGRTVWDMGCGWGAFTLAFLAEGARAVVGTDAFLDRSHIPASLFDLEGVRLLQGDTVELAPQLFGTDQAHPTLLFMHLVSEHVADLPALLRAIRSHCGVDTRYFIHHDNYYQPAGHHDHAFVSYRPEHHAVESNAVSCWASPERCAASETHRAMLRRDRAWQWSDASESTRDPTQCGSCNYRIRAQPWAHLLAAERFTSVFPEPFFTTALNKITPFQLRQFLMESGFHILSDVRIKLANEVPSELAGRFTDDDLRTFTVTIVATPK